jgi:hypothetical protein
LAVLALTLPIAFIELDHRSFATERSDQLPVLAFRFAVGTAGEVFELCAIENDDPAPLGTDRAY